MSHHTGYRFVSRRLTVGLTLLVPIWISALVFAQEPTSLSSAIYPLLESFSRVQDPLSGPSVRDQRGMDSSFSSILDHHLDGSIVSIGNQPELVILEHLQLTAEQLEALSRVRTARGVVLSKLAKSHFAELLEFGSLADSGEFEKNKMLLIFHLDQFARSFEEYFSRGSLLSEVDEFLTPTQRDTALRLLGEYRSAQVADRHRLHRDGRDTFEILLDLRMQEFGELIGESIQADASFENDQFQRFIHFLELTPAQISEVEAIYQEIGVQNLLGNKVSAADQLAAYAQVHQILNPVQRAKLRREFLRGNFNLEKPPLEVGIKTRRDKTNDSTTSK